MGSYFASSQEGSTWFDGDEAQMKASERHIATS
jgi:hypothetical protein